MYAVRHDADIRTQDSGVGGNRDYDSYLQAFYCSLPSCAEALQQHAHRRHALFYRILGTPLPARLRCKRGGSFGTLEANFATRGPGDGPAFVCCDRDLHIVRACELHHSKSATERLLSVLLVWCQPYNSCECIHHHTTKGFSLGMRAWWRRPRVHGDFLALQAGRSIELKLIVDLVFLIKSSREQFSACMFDC